MKALLYLFTTFVALSILSSCATTAKVWKPYDNITIITTSDVNPDGLGKPSPIQIKIYELSSRSTFDNLDFDRAFYEAKTMLSDELISDAEYTIQPSDTIEHKIDLQKTANFIAILGGFIDIDNARWKHVYEVSPYGHYDREITIDKQGIKEGKVKKEEKKKDFSGKGEENNKDKKEDASISDNIDTGVETLEKANSAKGSIKGLLGK